jgi:hypothetical protein
LTGRDRKIWRRLQAECLLLAAGEEAKDARGINQVCAGLEAEWRVVFMP